MVLIYRPRSESASTRLTTCRSHTLHLSRWLLELVAQVAFRAKGRTSQAQYARSVCKRNLVERSHLAKLQGLYQCSCPASLMAPRALSNLVFCRAQTVLRRIQRVDHVYSRTQAGMKMIREADLQFKSLDTQGCMCAASSRLCGIFQQTSSRRLLA